MKKFGLNALLMVLLLVVLGCTSEKVRTTAENNAVQTAENLANELVPDFTIKEEFNAEPIAINEANPFDYVGSEHNNILQKALTERLIARDPSAAYNSICNEYHISDSIRSKIESDITLDEAVQGFPSVLLNIKDPQVHCTLERLFQETLRAGKMVL